MYRKKSTSITRKRNWWICCLSRNVKCKSLYISISSERLACVSRFIVMSCFLSPQWGTKPPLFPPTLCRKEISSAEIQYNHSCQFTTEILFFLPSFLPSVCCFFFSCKLFGKTTGIRLLLVSACTAFPAWRPNFLLFSSQLCTLLALPWELGS